MSSTLTVPDQLLRYVPRLVIPSLENSSTILMPDGSYRKVSIRIISAGQYGGISLISGTGHVLKIIDLAKFTAAQLMAAENPPVFYEALVPYLLKHVIGLLPEGHPIREVESVVTMANPMIYFFYDGEKIESKAGIVMEENTYTFSSLLEGAISRSSTGADQAVKQFCAVMAQKCSEEMPWKMKTLFRLACFKHLDLHYKNVMFRMVKGNPETRLVDFGFTSFYFTSPEVVSEPTLVQDDAAVEFLYGVPRSSLAEKDVRDGRQIMANFPMAEVVAYTMSLAYALMIFVAKNTHLPVTLLGEINEGIDTLLEVVDKHSRMYDIARKYTRESLEDVRSGFEAKYNGTFGLFVSNTAKMLEFCPSAKDTEKRSWYRRFITFDADILTTKWYYYSWKSFAYFCCMLNGDLFRNVYPEEMVKKNKYDTKAEEKGVQVVAAIPAEEKRATAFMIKMLSREAADILFSTGITSGETFKNKKTGQQAEELVGTPEAIANLLAADSAILPALAGEEWEKVIF